MGVYNPKAHFPESCAECDLNDGLFCPYLEVNRYIAVHVFVGTKHPDCPLVETKPHGRLIDADALLNKAWSNFYQHEDEWQKKDKDYLPFGRFYDQNGFEVFQQTVVDAPTVIGAGE